MLEKSVLLPVLVPVGVCTRNLFHGSSLERSYNL